MPLTAAFTPSQQTGQPSIITLTDTSTGTDVAVTQRRVFLRAYDGSYLVPSGTSTDYIEWAYANPSIDIDVLAKDMALNITVQWLDTGDNILYTATNLFLFTLYLKTFFYYLTELQSSTPGISQDTTYYAFKAKLWVNIISAENAIILGNDIAGAQYALDAGTFIVNNENQYF